MHTFTQVTIVMANIPGQLAKVGDTMRGAGVNISAISCSEGKDQSAVHMIVDDVDSAKTALKGMGTVSTSEVIGFKMKNKPGAIGMIGRACAAAGVNVRNMYATTCGPEAMVFVCVDDIAKAKAAEVWRDVV